MRTEKPILHLGVKPKITIHYWAIFAVNVGEQPAAAQNPSIGLGFCVVVQPQKMNGFSIYPNDYNSCLFP